MRSLALSLTFASSLIACGTTEDPGTTSVGVAPEPDAGGMQDPPPPPPPPGALVVAASFGSPDCDAAVLAFEALVRRADGTPVTGAECRWTFADGGTSDACAGAYELAAGGTHGYTLEVREPSTGAAGVLSGEAFVYPPLAAELAVSAPACGLELTFSATANATGEDHVEISPAENVVGGGLFLDGSGTAQVTVGGTYEVTYEIEHERPNGPICVERVTQPVTVVACHEHDEGCAH